jgi:hypothetical protein
MTQVKGYPAGLIETPQGKMTRREAAAIAGVPLATMIRRVWEGWPVEKILSPKLTGGFPSGVKTWKWKPRTNRSVSHTDDSYFIEKYEDRKKRLRGIK